MQLALAVAYDPVNGCRFRYKNADLKKPLQLHTALANTLCLTFDNPPAELPVSVENFAGGYLAITGNDELLSYTDERSAFTLQLLESGKLALTVQKIPLNTLEAYENVRRHADTPSAEPPWETLEIALFTNENLVSPMLLIELRIQLVFSEFDPAMPLPTQRPAYYTQIQSNALFGIASGTKNCVNGLLALEETIQTYLLEVATDTTITLDASAITVQPGMTFYFYLTLSGGSSAPQIMFPANWRWFEDVNTAPETTAPALENQMRHLIAVQFQGDDYGYLANLCSSNMILA